jgi:hypothetical protein
MIGKLANRFSSSNNYYNELAAANESEGGHLNSRNAVYNNDFNNAVANRINGMHANMNHASNKLTN